MLNLPDRLKLSHRNTPLHPLDRLSSQLGGPRIWLKRDDLTGCALSGNKIRKLEFVLQHALDNGYKTIVTCGGVQSNHCRATALACAQLGLQCHLILRGEKPDLADGNLLLDYLADARVSFIERREYLRNLDDIFSRICNEYNESGHKALAVPTGASNGLGMWGYISCAQELAHDFETHGIEPGLVVCATGSGGTQAGLTVGCNDIFGNQLSVLGIAVSDDSEYFQQKVRSDIREWLSISGSRLDVEELNILVNDNFVAPGYGVANPHVFETIRMVAALEGVVLDPVYTGKAFDALITLIKSGKFTGMDDIVFIHTGGIFGLFAQKEQLIKNN